MQSWSESFLENFAYWSNLIGVLAAILAAFSTILLLFASSELNRRSNEANAKLNKEAGAARKEAGEAIQQAAESNKRVSSNELRVAELEKEKAQLLAIGERAKESAARATAEAEKAKTEREKAEAGRLVLQTKLLEIEGKLKPRRITNEQQTNLVECLTKAPLKGKIGIFAGVLDSEAMDFAQQICDVLNKAGFDAHCPSGFTPDAPLSLGPPGEHLAVKDVSKPSPRAAFIQRCFLSAGIKLSGINSGDADFDSDSVEIIIGQR